MKPGSLVVELLPFLPPGIIMGRWTRAVKECTPLGIIYSGTDLYHVGLPLTNVSAPQCSGRTGEDALSCFRRRRNVWDTRDFHVPPNDVVDVIRAYLPGREGHRPESCEEQKKLAGEYRFVLYNVHCKDDGNIVNNETVVEMSLHHFYWDKDLTEIPAFAVDGL